MENQKLYGLLGRHVSYSFSKRFFTKKFEKLGLVDHSYEIFDCKSIEEVESLFQRRSLRGFNVTIPYKEKIISYLDNLSEEAKEIGAVNTVKILESGEKVGYNTDAFGFERTLAIHCRNFHQSALILGDGGAAKAIKYVLKKRGISYQVVARRLKLNFDNLPSDLVANSRLIIQATPVGTFPNITDCLRFPFQALSNQHLVVDLIYNPNDTQFLKNAARHGAKTVNGYYMLEQQAEKAWEIWKLP